MTPMVARRNGRRTAASALVLAVIAGTMLFGGAGTASAQPTQVTCTLLGGPLNEPVRVQPGERVQLVVVVPLLGTRVNVGPAQTVGNDPGAQLIQGTIAGVVGLVGQVCQALVEVQAVASPVLPPVSVPTVPGLPSQTVEVPLPGADVGVELGGTGGTPPPGTTPPPPGLPVPGQPPPGGQPSNPPAVDDSVNWRYDRSRLPMYDFSSVPYSVGYRFGNGAAPAFRYGQQVPGYSPQFGILPDTTEDLTRVGSVEALRIGATPVPIPVLLAFLMLAAVAGALARTWALRRA